MTAVPDRPTSGVETWTMVGVPPSIGSAANAFGRTKTIAGAGPVNSVVTACVPPRISLVTLTAPPVDTSTALPRTGRPSRAESRPPTSRSVLFMPNMIKIDAVFLDEGSERGRGARRWQVVVGREVVDRGRTV